MPRVYAPSPMAVSFEYYSRGGNTVDVDIVQNTRESILVVNVVENSVTMGECVCSIISQCLLHVENSCR